MRYKSAFLAFWLLGILFPMAWFTRFSAIYSWLSGYVFTSVWTHVVMHTFLFAVLAYLLGHVLARWPAACSTRYLVGAVLASVLGVALLQEGIQLLYTAQAPGIDEVLDLGVDLIGGVLGVIAFRWQARRGHRRAPG